MSDDDMDRRGFEEALRAMAEEATRSFERLSELEPDDIARALGIEPERAREWVEGAGRWLRAQAGGSATGAEDPLTGAGPHPLDVPTADQGAALAALDSGRWTIEPGTSALAAQGEGPGPRDALGLALELRIRDWVDADGRVTVTGRHALERWLARRTP